jgi:hypothetical protein
MTATNPKFGTRVTDGIAAAVARSADEGSWFWRHEGPTLVVAATIYGSWGLLLWFHAVLPRQGFWTCRRDP